MSKTSKVLLQAAVVFGLIAASGLSQAVCVIDSENALTVKMQRVMDETITPTNCPDPDSYYNKYTYFEITADLKLTKPISIPARVHLSGSTLEGGKNPAITADYETASSPDGTSCIFTFNGDQVILENVQINANTSAPANSNITDTAVCMKANFGKMNRVKITNEGLAASGVVIVGNNNTIVKSIITTQHVGVYVGGNNSQISTTKVTGSLFGAHIGSSKLSLFDNTLSGRLGIAFFSKQLPIGQAANLFLLNTVESDPSWEIKPASFQSMYGTQLGSMAQCGECIDSASGATTNILYADDGACQTLNKDCKNPLEGVKYETLYMQPSSQYGIMMKPTDMQIYLATPMETVDDKNAELPEGTTKTLPDMQTKVYSPVDGGGCSLSARATASGELNTILALLLGSMLAARACHSSKN